MAIQCVSCLHCICSQRNDWGFVFRRVQHVDQEGDSTAEMKAVCCRLWVNAPFVILGLWEERQEFQVPLFSNYREQATSPFTVFRATLQACLCARNR